MKKLMILSCAMAVSAIASAATYNWNINTADGCGLTAPAGVNTTGTAYLFVNEKVNQATMWNAILGGASWDTYSVQAEGTFSLNSGLVVNDDTKSYARVTSEYTATKQNLYVVFKDGDNYFIHYTYEASGSTAESGTAYALDMSYADKYVYGNKTWQSTSDTGGAGWYSVPEPTSGLLLLCGLAGLMLRRKQKQA